ncbi:3-oxoacyl-ACP synthase III family protein [Cyclobacterium xiamenense]|uniref:3-oxoacyl-ACP synthase III family protein n=1 Tax=Cyclobacterium xiamenense TaxID=1297121 RepID=UPI0012B94165|nr:ketoacyl-ACP synthase III [Cyclobacterium xiamenense]
MAFVAFSGPQIRGLAAAVPGKRIVNLDYTENFSQEIAAGIVEKTGIFERRFADPNTCASDLCLAAAQRLIQDTDLDTGTVDLLVFLSQTPDYRMPATSLLLQAKLGLSSRCMAFDVNLGCSGYVYGLSLVFSLLQTGGIRNALFLVGETRSRVYHPKDRRVAFLFGDAGSATWVGTGNSGDKSYFNLQSDGTRADLIRINGGGYRNPSSSETLREKVVDMHGNISTDEHGSMDGAEVFNFLIREIPPHFRDTLRYAGVGLGDIDFFLFHQANKFMNDYLAKKLKLDGQKLPCSLDKFGNTSSVSIPLTWVSELGDRARAADRLMLSGFGVGMSWASAILSPGFCHVSKLVEI